MASKGVFLLSLPSSTLPYLDQKVTWDTCRWPGAGVGHVIQKGTCSLVEEVAGLVGGRVDVEGDGRLTMGGVLHPV